MVAYPGLKSDNAFHRCPHLPTPAASDLETKNPRKSPLLGSPGYTQTCHCFSFTHCLLLPPSSLTLRPLLFKSVSQGTQHLMLISLMKVTIPALSPLTHQPQIPSFLRQGLPTIFSGYSAHFQISSNRLLYVATPPPKIKILVNKKENHEDFGTKFPLY